MTFVLAVLAIFFVWEAVLAMSWWPIPAALQPPLCYLAAITYVWPDVRLALAVCGAVTILHILVVQRESVTRAVPQIIRRRSSNLPDLP